MRFCAYTGKAFAHATFLSQAVVTWQESSVSSVISFCDWQVDGKSYDMRVISAHAESHVVPAWQKVLQQA